MKMKESLIRLEENLVFQERLVEGLHTALLEQGKQLERLEKLTHRQALRLLELEEAVAEALGRGDLARADFTAEKPPHYSSSR
jgi:uncharacterized coiled-coil protein SlyX